MPQDSDQRQVREKPVQYGLRGRFVESVEGLPQGRGKLTHHGRGKVGPGGRREARPGGRREAHTVTRVLAKHGARGLSSGKTAGQVGLHAADPHLVRLGVQPETAR